jgi:hypothetical protein
MADLNAVLQRMQQSINYLASATKDAQQKILSTGGEHALIRQELERQRRDVQNIADAMARVRGESGNGGDYRADDIRYIESIPGRRIPFDMFVTMPIGSTITSEQQQSVVVSQDGPFVAVARLAAFQSAFQFNRTDPDTGAQASFVGRSYGRWRPFHSAWDLNDAGAGVFPPTTGAAPPGTGAAFYASPSNHSSFRTMQFDGVINFLNQGAAYHRSNDPIPSAWYSTAINSPFELGAFDFFERGETLQWKATPLHANNPDAGNASGFGAGGLFPFIGSQYDVHEGIVDPVSQATSDPIGRLPDGILYLGYHGFRIIQTPGPVALT